MKEEGGDQSSSRNGNGNVRSAAEKERTKLRERQRRSITTKIFHGLRKHGGYRLSPRADINQVLRHLAKEAGWVVEPDGTTYRSHSSVITSNLRGVAVCPLCGNSSFISTIGGGGDVTNAINGACSTTASPRRTMKNLEDPILKFNFGSSEATTQYPSSVFSSSSLPGTYMHREGRCGGDGGPHQISSSSISAQGVHQYVQETRASNQNTPVGSPQRRTSSLWPVREPPQFWSYHLEMFLGKN